MDCPSPFYAGNCRGSRKVGRHKDGCDVGKCLGAWYLKGFAVGPVLRSCLGLVASLGELDDLLARLDHTQPFPAAELTAPRGRLGSPRRVALPDGWLDDPDGRGMHVNGTDAYAELVLSGG